MGQDKERDWGGGGEEGEENRHHNLRHNLTSPSPHLPLHTSPLACIPIKERLQGCAQLLIVCLVASGRRFVHPAFPRLQRLAEDLHTCRAEHNEHWLHPLWCTTEGIII